MGTTPIGNNIWEGSLKVCRVEYNGVDLGKTIGDVEIIKNEDVKDILYQQDGTQYYDKVPTGVSWQIQVPLGEISISLLTSMHDSMTASGAGSSMKIGKNIYHSWLEQALELKLKAIDEDGDASTDVLQSITCPKAYPEISTNIIYGADTQRGFTVIFHVFYDTTNDIFMYSGYASSLSITP